MTRNYPLISIRMVPNKVSAICVAGLISTVAIFTDASSAHAQKLKDYGAGIAAGIIGGAIIGGALSHGQSPFGAPQRYKTATHRHKHKDDEEGTVTPASASNPALTKDAGQSEGMSLAHGVTSTGSTEQGPSQSRTSAPEESLVTDKAR
jgi:hypothetical protein